MNMKMQGIIIASALSLVAAAQADVTVAGWDTWASPITASIVSVADTNFTSSVSATAGNWIRVTTGSSNETFGTVAGAAPNNSGSSSSGLTTKVDDPGLLSSLDFTITNNGATDYDLAAFHFDAQRDKWFSANDYTLEVLAGSGITTGVVVSSTFDIETATTDPNFLDFKDFDITLSGLADSTLSSGESATFRMVITGGNTFGRTFVDNFAVTAVLGQDTYEAWLSDYSVGALSNLTDDADNDLLDNLTEYAWDGEPDNASANGNIPVQSQVADGGTNYIQYVYFERDDAASRGLASILEVGSDLTLTNWVTAGIEFMGSGAGPAGFNAITNRISTENGAQQFLRLQIEYTP